MIEQTEKNPKLKQKLKTRHVTMISLGSIIGAGLFVGSSAVISLAGPSAFIAYAFTGIIVMLIMRMVGEMASAHPVAGAFVEYARLASRFARVDDCFGTAYCDDCNQFTLCRLLRRGRILVLGN